MKRQRLNINIFQDLFNYLTDAARKARTSKTQYVQQLLEQDKQKKKITREDEESAYGLMG